MALSPQGASPISQECIHSCTDCIDVLSGGTPKTTVADYWDGGIPFFTPKDAGMHFYVTDTEKHITEDGLKKCNSRLYTKNTVFITARGTVGKVVLAGADMAMNQSCYALIGKDGLSQPFVFSATKNQVDYLKTNTGGATFDTIIVDTFKRMKIVFPDRALIKLFDEIVESLFKEILSLINANQNLKRTRDLLLPKLMCADFDISNMDIVMREQVNVA